jgi:uncharacterized YccA/Bax inhibitor family protein
MAYAGKAFASITGSRAHRRLPCDHSIQERNAMQPASRTEIQIYFALLFLALGALLTFNIYYALQGAPDVWFTIAVLCLVIVAAVLRKRWSMAVVVLWAAIGIFGGAAMWLALFLDPEIHRSPGFMAYKSIMMVVDVYLIMYANDAFPPPTALGSGASDADAAS